MADRSALPPEILAQVPCKSCRVQKTKDGYKVYKYKAVKLPSGKWGNDSGTLIGIIVPGEGFHPNDAYQDVVNSTKGRSGENREKAGKKPTPFTPPPDGITDLAYGSYGLLLSLSLDLFGQLNRCFSYDVAAQVYSYAAILCAEGYLEPEQIADRYEGSILSLLFENDGISMDGSTLRDLLQDLCRYGMPARHFRQQLLEASGKEIAIRIPVFRPRTPRIDLDPPSYAAEMPDTRQTYLFVASDTASRRPVYLEMAELLELTEKRVGYFLDNETLQDATFLADPLLYTSELLAAMSRNGNRYVIPLPRDTEACQRIHQHVLNASKDFLYRKPYGEGLDIVSYCEEQIGDGKRVIAYKNLDEHNEACKQYLMALGREEDGYTRAEFDAQKEWWGFSFLRPQLLGHPPSCMPHTGRAGPSRDFPPFETWRTWQTAASRTITSSTVWT